VRDDRRFDEGIVHPRDNLAEKQRSQNALPNRSRDDAIGYKPFLTDPYVRRQCSKSNHADKHVADLKNRCGGDGDTEPIANVGYCVYDDEQCECSDEILEGK